MKNSQRVKIVIIVLFFSPKNEMNGQEIQLELKQKTKEKSFINKEKEAHFTIDQKF